MGCVNRASSDHPQNAKVKENERGKHSEEFCKQLVKIHKVCKTQRDFFPLLVYLEDNTPDCSMDACPGWASPPETRSCATLSYLNQIKTLIDIALLSEFIPCIIRLLQKDTLSLRQHMIYFLSNNIGKHNLNLINGLIKQNIIRIICPFLKYKQRDFSFFTSKVCKVLLHGKKTAKIEMIDHQLVHGLISMNSNNLEDLEVAELSLSILNLILKGEDQEFIQKVLKIVDSRQNVITLLRLSNKFPVLKNKITKLCTLLNLNPAIIKYIS